MMTGITLKDWIDIIDRDIERQNKVANWLTSKIGSASIILALMIWTTISIFIKGRMDFDLVLIVISMGVNFWIFYFSFGFLSGVFRKRVVKKRKASNFYLLKEHEELLDTNYALWTLIWIVLPIMVELYLLLNIQTYAFYLGFGIFIDINICIGIWIIILFKEISTQMYHPFLYSLKAEILCGDLTDLEIIKRKYFKIGLFGYPEVEKVDKNKEK